MNPIDFGGQRSKVNKFVITREDLPVMYFLIELCRHVNHGERMKSIDFGGHMSKVKVTMGIGWLTNVGCVAMLRFALLYFIFVFSFPKGVTILSSLICQFYKVEVTEHTFYMCRIHTAIKCFLQNMCNVHNYYCLFEPVDIFIQLLSMTLLWWSFIFFTFYRSTCIS